MPSSSSALVLRDHWRVTDPGELELVAARVITTEAGQDLAMESGTVLTTEGEELPFVPTLLQMKRHLRLESDDTEDNELLIILRDSAAAMLLGEIGQDAEITDYVGEADYGGCGYRFIKIDRSNVQAVSAVMEVDSDADETTIDAASYSVRYKNGVAYIEGEFNSDLDKEMVKVEYRRGFAPETAETKLMKQVVLDTVHSLYVSRGRLTEMTLRRSPAFNAAMAMLADKRSSIKWAA